jgi:hypothetical protein
MSLFFYGAVELKNDKNGITEKILKLAKEVAWNLDFEELQHNYSIEELFNIPKDRKERFLVFELKNEVYTALYGDYNGESMIRYYRKLAKQLNIPGWDTLEFGTMEKVNEFYRTTPPLDLPVLRFMRNLFENFSDREIILSFDEGFENRFNCREVEGKREELLQEAWMTIAFGYTWPNLRLIYRPR